MVYRRFRAIVSCKPGTRQTDVLRQLCDGTQAHGTGRLRGNIVSSIWHTAKRLLRAFMSLIPGTRYSDVLGELLSRKSGHGTQTCKGIVSHETATRYRDIFLGKYCHVNLAHGSETL